MSTGKDEVWASDEEFVRIAPNSIYGWTERGRLATTRPGDWLLVDEDAPPTTASNVNAGMIRALRRPEFDDWRFTARASDVKAPDPKRPTRRRGKIWLKAEPRV